MPKRRIFLAYCGAKEHIAVAIKSSLELDFQVVLWQEANWGGGILFDSIVEEIESCHLGVAVLSCDDEVSGTEKTFWAPRDNVILELGFFLSHFGKDRTAVVTVTEADGRKPKVPTDLQGWFHLEVDSSASEAKLRTAANRMRARFSAKQAQVILSLVPRSASRRGFNVLTLDDARDHWGKFQGKFCCLNPSWNMEDRDPQWMRLHAQRYRSGSFVEANYIVDIDRGRDITASEGPATGKNRIVDDNKDLKGITRFVKELLRLNPTIADQVEAKMRVFVRPGVRSEMTAFLSEYDGEERAFLFVRKIHENAVLEARTPEYVGRIREHINVFMAKRQWFRPSELEKLCGQMVGE